jgi:hypothetical protein
MPATAFDTSGKSAALVQGADGGQYLLVFPKLDLVVAMNCGNYHRPLTEQSAVGRAVVGELVLPSFVSSQALCRNVTRAPTHQSSLIGAGLSDVRYTR